MNSQQNNIFKKQNKDCQVLEISGFNTVSTKADENESALSIELPSRKYRKVNISKKQDCLNKLRGKPIYKYKIYSSIF
jgi:hypothetical protein